MRTQDLWTALSAQSFPYLHELSSVDRDRFVLLDAYLRDCLEEWCVSGGQLSARSIVRVRQVFFARTSVRLLSKERQNRQHISRSFLYPLWSHCLCKQISQLASVFKYPVRVCHFFDVLDDLIRRVGEQMRFCNPIQGNTCHFQGECSYFLCR
jgi:hypothetical protein